MPLAITEGWGPGAWKTYCDGAALGSPTQGWGGGRIWRMHRSSDPASDRIEGWGGGPQWKLFCAAAGGSGSPD